MTTTKRRSQRLRREQKNSKEKLMDDYQQQKRDDFIAGIKALLELYEQNESMPAPVCAETICVFADDLKHFLELRRGLGMHDKKVDDDYMEFERRLSPQVKLCLFVSKEKTCQRVKVGERVVPASPEIRIPAKPERVETEYRWICPESLLAESHNGEATVA